MNNIEKQLDFIKGNVKRYGVEIKINENIIIDILIYIDFYNETEEIKTFIISLNEKNVHNDFLFLFQNIIMNLDHTNLNDQSFVLELQKLFKDINEITEIKKITGKIFFEYLSSTLPKNYTFNGTINGNKTFFESSNIDIEYFKNMNYDLFLPKEY
jgi:hypothetical protein